MNHFLSCITDNIISFCMTSTKLTIHILAVVDLLNSSQYTLRIGVNIANSQVQCMVQC